MPLEGLLGLCGERKEGYRLCVERVRVVWCLFWEEGLKWVSAKSGWLGEGESQPSRVLPLRVS